MTTLTLTSEPDAPDGDKAVIDDGVRQHNVAMTGDSHFSQTTLFLRGSDGTVQGGLLASSWGGRMYVTAVWVAEEYRGQGYGRQLLTHAESEARAAGCRGIDLGTFSFQGRPFYEKQGYAVTAVIEDFPPGHQFFLMRKDLHPAARSPKTTARLA